MRAGTVTRGIVAGLLAMLLAACGGDDKGGEDFAIRIGRPVGDVRKVFDDIDTSDAADVFSGMTIDRTTPSGSEILYTILGKDNSATIKVRFEPGSDGKATTVRVSIDVPEVETEIDGKTKFLSEDRVEDGLKKALLGVRSDLEKGRPTEGASSDLASVLVGVAISVNPDHLREAISMTEGTGFDDFESGDTADHGEDNAAEADTQDVADDEPADEPVE